jgi:hypothetical protein
VPCLAQEGETDLCKQRILGRPACTVGDFSSNRPVQVENLESGEVEFFDSVNDVQPFFRYKPLAGKKTSGSIPPSDGTPQDSFAPPSKLPRGWLLEEPPAPLPKNKSVPANVEKRNPAPPYRFGWPADIDQEHGRQKNPVGAPSP